jgi:hypothetical protein
MRVFSGKIGERYFASGGPGAVIDIAPGLMAQVTARGQLLECGGFLRYSGPTGFEFGDIPSFQLTTTRAADSFLGPSVTIALEGGAGNALQITRPQAGTLVHGSVVVPPTFCIMWVGFFPPGPGTVINGFKITTASALQIPVGA